MFRQLRLVGFPAEGGWRVHAEPTVLQAPQAGIHGSPNRFDDSEAEYGVRYFATSKHGAFLEVLGWFRRDEHVRARLAAVGGVDEDKEPSLPEGITRAFLAALKQVQAHVADGGVFVDVGDPPSQRILEQALRVRVALEASGLGSPDVPIELDEATIRLGGPRGRLITQAVSRVVFEETDACGIRYTSRFDVMQECWAVFDWVEIAFSGEKQVSTIDPDLIAAAAALQVPLPAAAGGS